MLPPLLLRVLPGHAVLDLCAAPGSKTVLLLAQLTQRHAAARAPAQQDAHEEAHEEAMQDGGVSRAGVVVANDLNPQRCNRLRVRLARSRVAGTVLSCHAAQLFPGDGSQSQSYDRVLADVPCSGDGTLRKNPDIWDSWQPRFSASLHPLQCAILTRGLQLLREGGYLVYSTCSFSPVENEAVIAAALTHCSGVELVEINGALPQLVSSPGLSKWRVNAAADGSGISTYAEASEEQVEEWRLCRTLFAPPAEAVAALALHRCLRVLPHAQDTGGFFVALLHKRAGACIAPPPCATPLLRTGGGGTPATSAQEAELALQLEGLGALGGDDDEEGGDAPLPKGEGGKGGGEGGGAAAELEPADAGAAEGGGEGGVEGGRARGTPFSFFSFTPVAAEGTVAAELARFYGLSADFPWAQLLSSFAHTVSRRLYLTTPEAATALRTPGLRVLHAGVRVFELDSSLVSAEGPEPHGKVLPWKRGVEG